MPRIQPWKMPAKEWLKKKSVSFRVHSSACCLCEVVRVLHSIPLPLPFSVSDSPHLNGRVSGSVLMHGRNIKTLLLPSKMGVL